MRRPLTLFATLALLAFTAVAAAAERTNVLFFAVDDLNTNLGCYGHKIVKSPNIDALAARGTRFEHAYTTYPLCNPSRTSLLNGRYPTTTEVMDNEKYFRDKHPEWVTLPEHFKNNVYYVARTGKIFHGTIDDVQSWEVGGQAPTPRPPRTAKQETARRDQADRWVGVEGDGHQLPDYITASRAIELLENRPADRPFFLACGFVKPHVSLISPKKYFDMYDASQVTLSPDFQAWPKALAGAPAAAVADRNNDLFIERVCEPDEARAGIAGYYACVSWMDSQVGRVMEALDRLKLADDTVIIFWGDHGFHLGEKGKWSKHTSLYEPATRVPLILALPGGKHAGQVCSRTVELIDMYPTLVELCALPTVAGLEGQSLVPLLENPKAEWDHPAYSVTRRADVFGRSVRTERYRYTEWHTGDKTEAELYDYESDPHELKNLAADPKHADLLAEMSRRLNGDWPGAAAR